MIGISDYQEHIKKTVAKIALNYIPDNIVFSLGSGSTINYFIQALTTIRHKIKAIIAGSVATEEKLKANNFEVWDLREISELSLYIDEADAHNKIKQLVKGGGDALAREKILANMSSTFICLVDETKSKSALGTFPIPIEIIPIARSFVAREILKLGGRPILRNNFKTDNHNLIIDVHDWTIEHPINLERTLNNIPGVVCNGLFATRCADKILIGKKNSTIILE